MRIESVEKKVFWDFFPSINYFFVHEIKSECNLVEDEALDLLMGLKIM